MMMVMRGGGVCRGGGKLYIVECRGLEDLEDLEDFDISVFELAVGYPLLVRVAISTCQISRVSGESSMSQLEM